MRLAQTTSLARLIQLLFLVLLFSSATASHGEPPPAIHQLDEMLPGLKPKQVYDVSGIEQLNLFSGDPHLAIPLGPSYPLAYGQSFQLTAHYSAKFWNVSSAFCYNNDGLCQNDVYVSRRHVGGHPTLGVGWTLEVGYIAPRILPAGATSVSWRTPDGATHDCHADGSDTVASCGDLNVRMRLLPEGGYRVQLPDGSSQLYQHRFIAPSPANGFDFNDQERFEPTISNERFGLSEIRDRLDRPILVIRYRGEDGAETVKWRIDRILLRRGEEESSLSEWPAITFHWKYDPSEVWPVLDYVEFPPSASTGGNSERVTFTFQDDPVPILYRSLLEDEEYPGTGGCHYDSAPAQAALPFLKSIRLPGGQEYSFTYVLTEDRTNIANGVVSSVTLPTGGKVTYGWGRTTNGRVLRFPDYAVPSPEELPARPGQAPEEDVNGNYDPCEDLAKSARFLDLSPAVDERTESDPFANGGPSTSTTSYERAMYATKEADSSFADPFRAIRRVIVDRPNGNAGDGRTYEAHYFAAVPMPGAVPVELETRTWYEPTGTPPPNRSTVTCFATDPPTEPDRCGVLELASGSRWVTVNLSGIRDNQLTKQVVWYGANPLGGSDCSLDATKACHQTAYSGLWNPTARKYPVATQSIDRSAANPSLGLVPPDWSSRITTTNLTPVATSGTWLPGLFDSRSVTESYTTGCTGTFAFRAPCATLTRYTFNQTNGFLEAVSTVNASSPTEYLRTTWTPDAEGNPATEVKSGTGIVSSTVFTTNRLFQHGLVTKSSRAGLSDGWASVEFERDPVTGLITVSSDPNGLETRFTYDGLGRLTSITPPGETASTYAYFDFDPKVASQAPFLLAKRTGGDPRATDDGRPAAGSGSVEAYQYDGFGRMRRQLRRLPNPTSGSYFALQESRYDAASNLSYVSEWAPCAPGDTETDLKGCFGSVTSSGTTWSNFDVLGRARSIRLADGSLTTKSFDDWEYGFPDSDTAEVTAVQDLPNRTVTSGTRKDIFGRLLAVAEPSEPTKPEAAEFPFVSRYDYDTFGHLTRARVFASATSTQDRTFTYGGLGLLVKEKTPERTDDANAATTGITTYTSYDALGNILAKSLDEASFAFVYDELGRLETAHAGGTLYLRNTWDEPRGTPARTNYGRLTTRLGANPSLSLSVTESFDYSASTGRPATKSTAFGAGLVISVTERWHYNDLGLLATYNHPRPSGLFSVSTIYRSGQPVYVSANGLPVVLDATYHPSGSLASYKTGNGSGRTVTTSIEIDSDTWMPRPRSISTVGASTNLSTGTYGYDGRGNILTIGADIFTYDTRSRLNEAIFGGDGYSEYWYDALGNLTTATPFRFEISAVTNHILNAWNRLEEEKPAVAYAYERGNLTNAGPETYSWDAFDRMTMSQSGTSSRSYAYTGANERILSAPTAGITWAEYTLRDAENRIATQLRANQTSFTWTRDNVYLGNLLVGSYHSCPGGPNPGWEYLASDHLGTPRLATDPNGTTLWRKKYWPYGEEALPGDVDPNGQPLTFALMEKDARIGDYDIERFYDHARTHSSTLGRFLSPDALGGTAEDPQSLNRYVYARNNPLKYVDPDGKNAGLALGLAARKVAQKALLGAATGIAVRLGINMLIRSGNPNYDVKTGVAGAALNGALVGATGGKSAIAKVASNVLGSTAGTLKNGYDAGHSVEQLKTDALNGALAGVASGVVDAFFSPGLGQISSNVPSAAGAEAVDTVVSAGISVTGSTTQESWADFLALLDVIAGTPNPSPVRDTEQKQ